MGLSLTVHPRELRPEPARQTGCPQTQLPPGQGRAGRPQEASWFCSSFLTPGLGKLWCVLSRSVHSIKRWQGHVSFLPLSVSAESRVIR